MVPRCLKSCTNVLKEKGIDAEVINLSAIKPFDKQTVMESVKKTGKASNGREPFSNWRCGERRAGSFDVTSIRYL